MADLDPIKVRRATAAAQALLRENAAGLVVDGKAGTFTYTTYVKAPASVKADIDRLMVLFGFPGSMKQLYDNYRTAKTVAVKSNDPSTIFDLQVVPAVIRRAKQYGVDPYSAIAQIAIETGWGKSTPKTADGGPSYNYAGIKWNAVKTPKKALARTSEFIKGKEVSLTDAFAVFDSPDEFAQAYFNYLLVGPSSYRYPGLKTARNAKEFGAILQKGGYATDPNYATKFASIAATAERKYSLA